MKKCIIFIFASLAIANTAFITETRPAPYVDFGVHGHMYDIVEDDLMHIIEAKAKSLKFDENETKKIIESEVLRHAKYESQKPLCLKDNFQDPEIDYYTVPIDIPNMFGRIILKKGQVIKSEIPAGTSLTLCFIDARVKEVGINQINEMSKKYPGCIFLISNRDVREFSEIYPKLNIYPSSKPQEDRFNIGCYPSVMHFVKDTKQKFELSYERFKN